MAPFCRNSGKKNDMCECDDRSRSRERGERESTGGDANSQVILNAMKQMQTTIGDQIAGVGSKVDKLEERMDKKFVTIDERMGKQDKRIEKLETQPKPLSPEEMRKAVNEEVVPLASQCESV